MRKKIIPHTQSEKEMGAGITPDKPSNVAECMLNPQSPAAGVSNDSGRRIQQR